MSLTIKEISNKKGMKKFIQFPDILYKENEYYVPPIHSKELHTLSFDTNPAFDFCKAKYWLAIKDGRIVGRIAGIINNTYNKKHNIKYVRFGWLDFIKDQNVLNLLIDTVEKWGLNEKMEYIHGPLGFNSFDPSGILIKGFDEIPTSFAHYNFPYYSELIEEFGYKKDVDWIENNVKVPKYLPEKFLKGYEFVKKRYNLKIARLTQKKDLLRYSDGLFNLLNNEYEGLYAFTQLTKRQIVDTRKQFISILNPKYVSIILDSENKVVASGVTVPSLSKALQKAKGKLFPFGFIHIKNALRKNNTVDMLLIAVHKKFQNKGVHGLIFYDIINEFIKNGITQVEATRELENNMKVNNLWNKFEFRQHKTTRCYIKKL